MAKAQIERRSAEAGEKRTSLVDNAMRAAIRDASFAPGSQADEQEIALRLGMSRTPVDEAAIRLLEDGLVRVLPRKASRSSRSRVTTCARSTM